MIKTSYEESDDGGRAVVEVSMVMIYEDVLPYLRATP